MRHVYVLPVAHVLAKKEHAEKRDHEQEALAKAPLINLAQSGDEIAENCRHDGCFMRLGGRGGRRRTHDVLLRGSDYCVAADAALDSLADGGHLSRCNYFLLCAARMAML